ncbi:MAG: anthranilate synthase component I [Fimbriimonadaceae bacterium]|nr:anthranilate synthase component I [Fimbriimonadaceae bacterium]MCZ7581236.1 anthranilate synthase component I [Fimbriimonadaceae bacterium]QOJ12142.1 MAG: anthranilate synthase component I [Chthonomonadaceae bacterium]WKZ80217.1 MAG: anthranilate synthase component I [Fimbriimonadaceae bacterium]
MIVPSIEEYRQLAASGRRIPVYCDLLADMETPLGAYWKLAQDQNCSFLLESVTGGEHLARYSILGSRPRLTIRSRGNTIRRITRSGEQHIPLPPGEDPLAYVARELAGPEVLRVPGMPKFIGGAVGLVGYDFVRFIEDLPHRPPDDLEIDDVALHITDCVVVFDHARNLIRILALADGSDESYAQSVAEIERVAARLSRPLPELPASVGSNSVPISNQTREQYESAVRRVKEYIEQGDCIQAVLAQRLSVSTRAHPLTIYRALRSFNPSPYMFLVRFGDFDLVGASPELLVSLDGRTCRVRPIAGTRRRGASPEEDAQLEAELLADQKELAEHIMLVDLGRNDLGRVCRFGTVAVREKMAVERYSHVMHIVSEVTGELGAGRDAYDLLRATFPAGTVSGAPKVRAMEIIDELEPTSRGPYAGCVGYIGFDGAMDTAIAIRTILLKNGTGHVYAGAGIVFDSVPEREYDETLAKAEAALRALRQGSSGGRLGA